MAMAIHRYLLGLVGLVGAIACGSTTDDEDVDDSGNGGNTGTGTNARGGNGNSVAAQGGVASDSQNTADIGQGGARPVATGGTRSTASTPSTESNPNRNLTESEATAITQQACNAWAIEPEASAGNKIELVIDVSSSMSSRAPGTNQTKWEVTREALVEAVPGTANGGGLPGNTSVGMMFYPNMVNETVSKTPTEPSVCLNTEAEVAMDVLGGNSNGSHREQVRNALNDIVLGRGTPTADAYAYVLYNTVLSEVQTAVEGDPYMLLITDGMPTLYQNCYNPSGSLSNLEGDPIVALIDDAFNHGVKTFVVGSPGSEDGRAWLSKAAWIGGTAAGGCNITTFGAPYCHMDMTTAADFSVALRNGLASVMSMITTCRFEIPATSADGTQSVDVDKIAPIIRFSNGQITLVGKTNAAAGSACNEGYRIVSNTQMELCKNTCSLLQSDAQATVQFIFGCAADQIDQGVQQ
ncbi:MAG TPA: hypothetical protein VIV60_35715 [Polyangiaceae bacterium]